MKSINQANELFKKQFANPRSKGETEQVEKIKKLSEDPDEIIQYRKELINTKKKFQSLKDQDDKLVENKQPLPRNLFSAHKPEYNKRNSDKKIFKKPKPGFFSVFSNIFSLIASFKNKYLKQKKVRVSLLNYFGNGSFFYPDSSVTSFAAREILPFQESIKPFLKEIYSRGWCNARGKRILDPYGFNLISQCERFMDKKPIEEFLIFSHSPEKAITVLNNFVLYYYNLLDIEDNFKLLISNIQKILTATSAEKKNIPAMANIKFIVSSLKELQGKKIGENFLIPIFECFLARPIEKYEMRNLIEIEPISRSEYYADARLFSLMKAKEAQYEKYLSKKIKEAEEMLDLTNVVKEALNYKVKKSDSESLVLLDFAIGKIYPVFKGFPHLDELHPYQKSFFALKYFLETYSPFLSKTIEVKKNIAEKDVQGVNLFSNEVFEIELDDLFKTVDKLKEIAARTYSGDIFSPGYKGAASQTLNIHLATLNNVADEFFGIGEKLHRYLKENEKTEYQRTAINLKTLGKKVSIFDQFVIFQIPDKNFNEGLYFFQRKVREVLIEIRDFCFQYTYHLESHYRNFSKGHIRDRSLRSLVADKPALEKNLTALISGEELED